MRKTASLLALVFGAMLLVSSLYMWQDDASSSAQHISNGFQSINSGNQSAFNRQMDQQDSRSNEEGVLAIVGVGFAIAGIAMYKRDPEPVIAS